MQTAKKLLLFSVLFISLSIDQVMGSVPTEYNHCSRAIGEFTSGCTAHPVSFVITLLGLLSGANNALFKRSKEHFFNEYGAHICADALQYGALFHRVKQRYGGQDTLYSELFKKNLSLISVAALASAIMRGQSMQNWIVRPLSTYLIEPLATGIGLVDNNGLHAKHVTAFEWTLSGSINVLAALGNLLVDPYVGSRSTY